MSNTRVWVVGLDLSELSERVLAFAASDLEQMGGGTLVVSHAALPTMPPTMGLEVPAAAAKFYEQAQDEAESEAKKALGQLITEAQRAHPNVDFDVVVHTGEPHDEILGCAKARDASRIVVGSLGKTGLTRLLLGSVAERIARLAEVPVTIVK